MWEEKTSITFAIKVLACSAYLPLIRHHLEDEEGDDEQRVLCGHRDQKTRRHGHVARL